MTLDVWNQMGRDIVWKNCVPFTDIFSFTMLECFSVYSFSIHDISPSYSAI